MLRILKDMKQKKKILQSKIEDEAAKRALKVFNQLEHAPLMPASFVAEARRTAFIDGVKWAIAEMNAGN
jgi:hypothetical protein